VSPRAKAPAKKPAKSRAPRQPGLRRLRRVGIVSKAMSREAVHTAGELAEWLRRRDVEAALDEATLRALGKEGGKAAAQQSEPPFCLDDPCDLVVALGGDGTLLSVARSLAGRVPILGVNLGNLGFLTEINRGELYPSLVRVLAGRYSIEERSLYDVELRRHGGDTHAFQVFNDAVIAKSALSRIVELSLRVDGHLVARFRADGLIISTPTGSTAYNLSAGGPILHPLLPVAVLTPICPHALSLRPMVVSDASLIEVTLETPSEEVYLTLDGQEGEKVGFRDTVAVTRGAASVRLIKVAERTYYDNLRGKLRWGGLQGREDGGEEPA
jgi:NAD+ kinase